MAEFIMKCPHCQNDLQVGDEWIGMNVDCPLCSKTFTVQKSPARRSKNNSRTSSTPKYYCSNCKKEYPEPVKFCSECGSEIKTKSSKSAKKSTQSDNSKFYEYFWLIVMLIGGPVLLTIWIDWPRTIFWCTIPFWGGCLGVFYEINKKLQILLFVVIICWGWWAHTRVEIPTPEQTEESRETNQVPVATSEQAKQKLILRNFIKVINIDGHPEAKGAKFSFVIPSTWFVYSDNNYEKNLVHYSIGGCSNGITPFVRVSVDNEPKFTRRAFANDNVDTALMQQRYREQSNNVVDCGFVELAGNAVFWSEKCSNSMYCIIYSIPDNERSITITMAVARDPDVEADVKAEFERYRGLFEGMISSFNWN